MIILGFSIFCTLFQDMSKNQPPYQASNRNEKLLSLVSLINGCVMITDHQGNIRELYLHEGCRLSFFFNATEGKPIAGIIPALTKEKVLEWISGAEDQGYAIEKHLQYESMTLRIKLAAFREEGQSFILWCFETKPEVWYKKTENQDTAVSLVREKDKEGFLVKGSKIILDALSEIVVVYDQNMQPVWANNAACKSAGLDIDNIAGKNCFEIWSKQKKICPGCPVQEAMASRQPRESEILHPNGQSWYVRGFPLFDSDGQLSGAIEIALETTSQKKAEAAFRESEERFRILAHAAHEGVALLDTGMRIIEANDSFARIFGYSLGEIQKKPITEFVVPEHKREFQTFIQQAPEGTLRYQAMKKKGTRITAEINVRSIPLGKEKFRVITVTDVSEQLYAEKIRVQDIDRMETLIELNRMMDLPPRELYNIALEKVLWLTESSLGFIGRINPDETEMDMEAFSAEVMKECNIPDHTWKFQVEQAGLWAETIRQRKAVIINDYEAYNPWKRGFPSGHVLLKRFLTVPVFDKGKIVLVACVANKRDPYEERDARQLTLVMDGLWRILQRKQAEEMLQISEKKFRSVVEANPLGMHFYSMSENGSVILSGANPAADKMLHIKHNSFLGKPLQEIFKGFSESQFALIQSVFVNKKPIYTEQFEYHDKHFQGTLEAFLFPLSFDSVVCIFNDVTERIRLNRELVVAKEKAEESDRLKSAFLANMSHEIRTPINSILGFSYLLADENINPAKRKLYTDIIQTGTKQLLTLINDIIDLSKLEARQLKLHYEPCSLNKLMQQIYQQYEQERIRKQKNELLLEYRCGLPQGKDEIQTDPVRLQQVLANLLSNGMKFTQTGYIRFEYKLSDDKKMVLFSVSDTGKGIHPDKISVIFERFRQEDETISTQAGGSGLGLSISKGLVDLFGGRIWAESEPGKGSVFYFTIPYLPEPEKEKPVHVEEKDARFDLTGRKILLIEDTPSNLELLREMLTETHAVILEAVTGKEGLQVMEQETHIDLVLADICLPDLDGYSLIRSIRSAHPLTPVIAQTAYAYEQDKQKCLEAGASCYLAKPFLKEDLLQAISNSLLHCAD